MVLSVSCYHPRSDQVSGKPSTPSELSRALAMHVGKPTRKTNPVTDWRQQAAARLPPGRATHRAPQSDKSACPALHLTENDYICRVRQIEIALSF